MDIERMKKETRKEFDEQFGGLFVKGTLLKKYSETFLDHLINHIHEQTVRECMKALPGWVAPHDSLPIELTGEASNAGYNYHQDEALTRLEALLNPGV